MIQSQGSYWLCPGKRSESIKWICGTSSSSSWVTACSVNLITAFELSQRIVLRYFCKWPFRRLTEIWSPVLVKLPATSRWHYWIKTRFYHMRFRKNFAQIFQNCFQEALNTSGWLFLSEDRWLAGGSSYSTATGWKL